MKRLAAVFSVVLVLLFQITAYAQDDVSISLEKAESDEPGQEKVNVNMAGGSSIEMLQFCIEYDSTRLKLVSDSAGSSLSGNTAYSIHDDGGKIYFVWDSLTAIQNDGTLLTLTFESVDGNGGTVRFSSDETFIVADKDYVKRASVENTNSVTVFEDNISSQYSSREDTKTNEGSESSEDSGSQKNETGTEEKETGHNKGIELDKYDATVKTDEETVVTASQTGESLFWSSSNENVATVDEDGKITAHSPGVAIITVSNEYGTKESTCVVTVTDDDIIDQTENNNPKEEIIENSILADTYETTGKSENTALMVSVFLCAVIAVCGAAAYIRKIKK